ncbi:presequence translocated-associated motor subunit [Tieghemostelium lacteum]|uniref:Presequence translocated-associated motor subunit n=1 Tax=Tieghemostelium lacteum TaxID=361077 RepID=A0A152A6X8_TIELA|nr:presequence translocated-associated motor subunit [Tieghemostelium lacteum]|eukprot:KYR01983.1 presequence translocated-associated motor subunit [Tieghemostelium lacteum]
MAAKLFAKLIFTGGTVLARSISMAYKQAIARAEGGSYGGGFNKMTPSEAKKILGFDNSKKTLTLDDVERNSQVLLELNDPKEGGSQFLQFKVQGAKNVLENAIKTGKDI